MEAKFNDLRLINLADPLVILHQKFRSVLIPDQIIICLSQTHTFPAIKETGKVVDKNVFMSEITPWNYVVNF